MAENFFKINFTLIDQIVYEIITNQFTHISVAALLTLFVPQISLFMYNRRADFT